MKKETIPSQGEMQSSETNNQNKSKADKPSGYTSLSIPQITLPKGGGAIKTIDEKFSVNAANGSAHFSIPFPFSPSRNGFMPAIGLSYNSGSGNGIFGLGWNAEPLSITRKTDKKLPEYNDSDTFIFSGAEDLVPSYVKDEGGNWIKDTETNFIVRYKPRTEGTFARIEKITEADGNVYWKVTSKDNIVSIYGRSQTARIFDPKNVKRIYKWLLEFSYDDKGNCFQFEYKKEDKVNVPNDLNEKNRLNDFSACTNAYIKRVKYCNKKHFDKASINFSEWQSFLSSIEYLLELVIDYGEHDTANPQLDEDNGWTCRQDAFSEYRPGFEIRTYRLCDRLLMFHHFTELGAPTCLVHSVNFYYDAGSAFTFLKSVIQNGYIRKSDGKYTQKWLPPIEFNYEPLGWNTEVKSLPKESLENLPVGIDDHLYQWIDLYGEGISGILTEQANSLYYKNNLGDGNFSASKLVSPKPSLSGINSGLWHFQDLEANGQKYLVSNDLKGYFELTPEEKWKPFKNFHELPNIDVRDPNLKFLDLDGDGRSDMLISENNVFVWYASKGKFGYDDYRLAHKAKEEEKGANIIFADGTQSIIAADMSGDGLMDMVRIRNSEIVYWPNLGYGKFGAKVTMSNAPLFDHPDHFNPDYIKLADLDGSGTTDIVYLGKDSFKIYFNQSGNSWSDQNIIKGLNPLPFPKIDDHTTVNVIDLLGNGTGCIVWSSPLPKYAGNPLRYIDLMGGKKPHIMTAYKNNMGKEVQLRYKPSTHFYLEDKKSGNPWITKLPFPVQCVSEVEVIDQITKTKFTNQYTYHHGYYDFNEREFRGFGRVDQTDTEDFKNYKKYADPNGSIQIIDEGFHQPPILTKTWFHTGAFIEKEKILNLFAHEYYQNTVIPENTLSEPSLPADLSIQEWREALRACKGMPLHVEVYSPDGTDKQVHPYTTAQHTCLIQLLQPMLTNQHAVFMVLEGEALTYTYERNPADPRIAHSMNIEADEFGNVLKAAAISYGRKTSDAGLTPTEQQEQSKTHIIFTENNFTNKIDGASSYLLPLLYKARTYELIGLSPAADYFSRSEIAGDFQQAETIEYQALPTVGKKEKRLIEHVSSLFLRNDLTGPLDPGKIESLALPYQSYKLALTPSLVQDIYSNKVDDALLVDKGKYIHFNDSNYWIASGTQTFDAGNFYQVVEIADPFDNTVQISYDEAYHFFVEETADQLDNTVKVLRFNFRTLSPYLVMDINDNRTAIRTDELGMVVNSFVMGKAGENKGDFIDENAAEASANDKPSSVLEYNLLNNINNGKPNYIKTSASETHYFESIETGKPVVLQTAYYYSDGGGHEVMHKVQAEPGIALQENENGTVTEVDTTPNLRWVGNGRTILNNKGKPVKQYEPYFSVTSEYEDAKELVERGVTPIIYYDSLDRVIKTELPDATFSKVEFDSWMQRSFDQNDTVLESPWYKDRIITPVPEIATPAEIDAANKAALHANTPAVTYLDSLGINFLSIADNAAEGKYKTVTETDIEGNLRKVVDARGNAVMQYKYDMLGNQLYSVSMDAGERWMVNDVMGKAMLTWDSRAHEFRYEYDELHRPVKMFLKTGNGAENNFEKIEYGENVLDDKKLNVRGKPYKIFDTAGSVINELNDFKGNALNSTRRLLKNYKGETNWDTLTDADLEGEAFTSETEFDALNRPVKMNAPGTDPLFPNIITPVYNEANLLNEVKVIVRGAPEKSFVRNIDYDAKGQREKIFYGNNVLTTYKYDEKTFRLKQLTTTNTGVEKLQDLYYTFDPVGNITQIEDKAQQTLFYNNAMIAPVASYEYDAVYQLKKANGREHIGQNQMPDDNWNDTNFTKLVHKGDGNAMRNYIQSYLYDEVGNIKQLAHAAIGGSYTRDYGYESLNNRLKNTKIGAATFTYTYDAHGNIDHMPHLALMEWDFKDQLKATQQTLDNSGTGEKTYYVYDASGQRIKKVTEQQGTTNKKEERIYLGGFEIYRSYKAGGTIELERETLHIMDDTRRISLVETKTKDNGSNDTTLLNASLTRYQHDNHLGSASLELDDNAAIVSYEEYHPYGTTAYQATDKIINLIAKRYRYTGMERDEESGFEYHSARYYLPWLGRWLSADSIGIRGGINLYGYCINNPILKSDTDGNEPKVPNNDKDLGNIADKYVSMAMAARLQVENPTAAVKKQVYTKPGGTKKNMDPFFSRKSKGKIDLAVIDKGEARIWEIKPDTPDNINKAEAEAKHYLKFFPDQVDGVTVNKAVLGEKLAPLNLSFNITPTTTITASVRSPRAGVIVYKWGIEPKKQQKQNSQVSLEDWDVDKLELFKDALLISVAKAFKDASIAADAAKASEVAAAARAATAAESEIAAAPEEVGFFTTAASFLESSLSTLIPPVPGFIFNNGNSNESI